MRRAWIGLALLSASWLFGLGYYHAANYLVWGLALVAGTGLLYGVTVIRPTRRESMIAAVMLFPVALVIPWPWRAAALLIMAGLLLATAPIPRLWPTRIGQACLATGTVLTAQAVLIWVYTSLTANSHELPGWLAQVPYAMARLLGIDATCDGTSVAMNSIRRVHRVGATWEWLLDPVTLSFLVGGMVLLCLHRRAGDRTDAGARSSARAIPALLICTTLWLPFRAALLAAIFMHRALRTPYDDPLVLMDMFWSPWVHLLLLIGVVLLTARFAPLPASPIYPTPLSRPYWPRRVFFGGAMLLGVFLMTFGLFREPSGQRKQGRIWVDEHHSTWEPTGRPYDAEWYGQESGYNYACIYDYCSRYYEMGRLDKAIEPNTLQACDVLIVKIPTARYDPNEIACIERFVESGGGLLLIGEHTDVFKSGTYLNDIAQRFGFRFRYDCVFGIDTKFNELYAPPMVCHPIVQRVPSMDFAVSCSIDPGRSRGRAAIRATGLWSLPADYHVSNFYPQVEDRPEARYGAFIQLWATHRQAGRIAAFTDSTIFSNFSTFEPGKAELMLGMLEWLNHRQPDWTVNPVLIVLGIALVLVGLISVRQWPGAPFVLLCAAMLGATWAGAAVRTSHLRGLPAPKPVRPFTHVVVDQSVCRPVLPISGFISGEKTGFGIFERWILRLGYFTSRARGEDIFAGDAVVFFYPNQEVPLEFHGELSRYVASGGKVLIVDSPANTGSTANSLLHPFGMTVAGDPLPAGPLGTPSGWPAGVQVDTAAEIRGGTPLIRLDGKPVAATIDQGKGSVTCVSFGSRFCDFSMGVTGDVIPDATLRNVYELQFRLLKSILGPAASGSSIQVPASGVGGQPGQ
jgi:hypothetical protein